MNQGFDQSNFTPTGSKLETFLYNPTEILSYAGSKAIKLKPKMLHVKTKTLNFFINAYDGESLQM